MGKRKLPKILVTGASGTIGRNLLEDLCEYYYIYALARRTQQDAGVLTHKNIEWILVDIAREASLTKVIENIKNKGQVDFVIHLAGYYDFGNEPHPEYERTNVQGTRLMLEHSKKLALLLVGITNYRRQRGVGHTVCAYQLCLQSNLDCP